MRSEGYAQAIVQASRHFSKRTGDGSIVSAWKVPGGWVFYGRPLPGKVWPRCKVTHGGMVCMVASAHSAGNPGELGKLFKRLEVPVRYGIRRKRR